MIKVKIPSYSSPQWNKAPRPKTNAKIGRMKRQPLKSASSSKIGAAAAVAGRKGETRADLAKSKSTPKVGQQHRQPEVIQVQELRLVKCLSGADDTLILPAEGDNVLSQADTFPADLDDDDDDDLISDEEVPDLEDAFVTAVSGRLLGKPNKSSMMLADIRKLSIYPQLFDYTRNEIHSKVYFAP